MLVVDLSCPHGHRFEGWFASADDLASQQSRGLVSCPVCGDLNVQRLPSAPHVHVSHQATRAPAAGRSRDEAAEAAQASGARMTRDMASDMAQLGQLAQVARGAHGGAPGTPTERSQGRAEGEGPQAQEAQALQALYWSAVRHVLQHTEDVGERFASDARAMHHGELPPKPIRGQLDAEEREALQDEGIEVVTLVVPKGLDGPVQ
jgi:hypothetical protein